MSARFRFFGGKGGVGKTTCAAAAALHAAESGRRVLVVSTDPAHSLGDALKKELGPEPLRIPTRRGRLLAAELDAERALDRWLGERRANLELIAERGTYLGHDDIGRFLDLGLPGVDELVGLVELMRLARELPDNEDTEVVVDTAPTAHTLRLLTMPGELRRFADALDRLHERHRAMAESFGGGWQPDQADALIQEVEEQGREIEELLRDPARTSFLWVLLPEALSVEETQDGLRALEEGGIPVPELIVNRVTPPSEGACARCDARRRAEREALVALREAFPERPVRLLPERTGEPRGMTSLRAVGRDLAAEDRGESLTAGPLPRRRTTRKPARTAASAWWSEIIPEIIPETVRLVFFGGKGGVGKTTCAAAAALLLAEAWPDRRVLLLSTDPAHSLADALEVPLGNDPRPLPGGPGGLRVRELDASRTFASWRARHLTGVEEWLDGSDLEDREQEAWRGLLDLAPPGLDELSAVSALADALHGSGEEPPEDLVIVDTAPTGHALRLLQAPGLMQGWVRELLALLLRYREAVRLGRLAEELVELSRSLRGLEEILHDPARTRFVAVTRAAELPRRETVRLLEALEPLGLTVPAVIVDAVTDPGCPLCERAAATEEGEIRKLRRDLVRKGDRGGHERCAIISAPAVFPPPRGLETLRAWGETWTLRP
jgi:arsenite-transporting ATPase